MFRAYKRLRRAGIRISMREILAMKIRGTFVDEFVDAVTQAKEAGINPPLDLLEAHILAKGDVRNVVAGACALKERVNSIPWNALLALDLAAHDALDSLVQRFLSMVGENPNLVFGDLCSEFWRESLNRDKQIS